eukprot:6281619-Prymnesium_polylepis.1
MERLAAMTVERQFAEDDERKDSGGDAAAFNDDATLRIVYRNLGKMMRLTVSFASHAAMRRWLQGLVMVVQLYPDPLPGSTHRQ